MYATRMIVWLLASMMPSIVWANGTENDYKTRRSPTMAVFYSVADDGRAVREAIDVAVIADPDSRPSRMVVTGRPKPEQRPKPEKSQPAVVKILVAPKHKDGFAEVRCDRFGFYYTAKGECVAAAVSSRHPGKKVMYVGQLDSSPGKTRWETLPGPAHR